MAKLDQNKTPFFTKLKEYATSQVVPLDVPGHKLGAIDDEFSNYVGTPILRLDSNAPRGLDNLSKPTGVIKEAQSLMADAFGGDRAYFLTGGTSQGIMAMIMSTCRAKEKIIMPRNVHKSAINGLVLSGAMPIFIKPHIDIDLGIANGINLSELKQTIEQHPDAKAIFVINPTYFGVTSNLSEIVKLAHENDMLVLVDEAHGAHFGFSDMLPESAMQAGADLSAMSLHKTIGSLTQSSVLIAQGDRFDYNRLKSTLNILQSTSPSALFMASLDVARKNMFFHGKEKLEKLIEMNRKAREKINQIDGLETFDKEYFYRHKAYEYDETKIIVKVSGLGITGFDAYKYLSTASEIQLELAETHIILAVLSIGTTQKDLDRFIEALEKLAKEHKQETYFKTKIRFTYPDAYTRPREAYHAPKKYIKIEEALDEIAAENVMIYPPGIPLVIPGEIINEDILDDLAFYKQQGSTILSDSDGEFIKVVDKESWEKWSDLDE